MRDVVIDTDAASLLQKSQAPAWVLRHVDGARVWLTFITVGELAKWAVVRRWGQDRRRRLEDWTAARPVIPYDPEIARVWSELAGAAQLRGRPRPQNDTWIAASSEISACSAAAPSPVATKSAPNSLRSSPMA